MDSKSSKKSKQKGDELAVEADVKASKEDVCRISLSKYLVSECFILQGDLRGLGAFLFDDADGEEPKPATMALILMMNRTGPSTSSKQDDIQKDLNAIGAYMHLNNLQLLPTGVEEARYGKASKVGFYCRVYNLVPSHSSIQKQRKSGQKRRSARGAAQSKSPEPVWPPLRKKHRPPPSPQTK